MQPKSTNPIFPCYRCREVRYLLLNCLNPKKVKKPRQGLDLGKGKGQKV